MALQGEHFRVIILYDQRSGLTQQDSVERLCAAFPDQAPSRTTIFKCFAEFRRGRQSLRDEPRSGRLRSAITEDHMVAMKAMVEKDAPVTVAQLAHHLDISSKSVVVSRYEVTW